MHDFRSASEKSSKRGALENTKCCVLPGSPRGPGEPCHPAGLPTHSSPKAGTRLSTRNLCNPQGRGAGLGSDRHLTSLPGCECAIF